VTLRVASERSSLVKPYWQSEEHGLRIYCGDCIETVPRLEAQFDFICADPPYGHQAVPDTWDAAKPPLALWPLMHSAMKTGGALYYWGFWQDAGWIISNAEAAGFVAQSRLIWWFATGRPQKSNYRQDTETAWYFTKGGEAAVFNAEAALEPYEDPANYRRYGREGKHPGTVWRASRIFHNHPENCGHPTQKPLEIVGRMIEVSSVEGDALLDPFAGSGTTLVAAYRLGRHATGIEISEEYCELAARRLEAELAQDRLFEPAEVAATRQEAMTL
jgi:site-specific DNA-methyltransferase (adenine-specific)